VHGRHGEASTQAPGGRQCRAANARVRDAEFGLAVSVDTLDAACRLVHDQYVSRGFMTPHPSGLRLGVHHALPTTKVFVATVGPQVVGTVTLIEDSPLGLPMEEIYRRDLDRFRAEGRRLAEASALAADPTYRGVGLPLLLRLMRVLVLYALDLAPLDLLCIAVNPRHVEFYRRVLRFEIFGELKSYEKVNGAPAVALRLDLEGVREIAAAVRSSERPPDNLTGLFFAGHDHAGVARRVLEQLPAASAASERFVHRHCLDELAVGDRATVSRPAGETRVASAARPERAATPVG
jgi:GNAT superfamily N-acetyltransferase